MAEGTDPKKVVDGEGQKNSAVPLVKPVPKLVEKVTDSGPLEPLTLPNNLKWDDIDLENESQLVEVYTLLNENYVEDNVKDDKTMITFRFDYSRPSLEWALKPPGWKKEWHCGVRGITTGKLLGFISAVPARIGIRNQLVISTQMMAEINFLCVHKDVRGKRVAPVLIKEITRRARCQVDIFQTVYTAAKLLPNPVASCRYWHRHLDPKKLREVKYSSIYCDMTLEDVIHLCKLPKTLKTKGLRTMEARDVPTVHALVNKYLEKFDLFPVFETKEDIEHWFLPKPDIISSYVVENPESKVVTDVISFYHLPTTVINHPVHKTLHAVYSFYNVSTCTPMKDLMQDALFYAKREGADVFNALDLMDNKQLMDNNKHLLEELKFNIGVGRLHYYLYNSDECPEMLSEKVGLVLP